MHRAQYQAGVKQGQQETWYKDGQPQSVSHFKGNKLDGEETLWTEEGLKTRFVYKEGLVVDFDLPEKANVALSTDS